MKVGQELRIRGKKAATRSKDASDSENAHMRFERMNSGMSITSPSDRVSSVLMAPTALAMQALIQLCCGCTAHGVFFWQIQYE